jgi:acetyl esterase
VTPIVFDPEILAARKQQAEHFPAFDPASLPTHEARSRMNQAALFFSDSKPELFAIHALAIEADGREIPGRLYQPTADQDSAAILFLHGGGWFSCNTDTHDRLARCLALEAGAAVLSIDYRLAPEHPFPAALDDTIAAWRWLHDRAARLGLDRSRLAVAGDSAGANLALALCVAERDAKRRQPAAAALLYGCFAPVFDTPSQRQLGDGRAGLTTARMRWYWSNYLGGDLTRPPLLAAPSLAGLAGLPPIYISYAELDPLADESRLLAAALQRDGVDHELVGWPRVGHGFMQLTRDAAIARTAVAAVGRFLARIRAV